MRAAVAFLARFCREHPLEDKLLLVPSFVAGRQIGNALAEEAGSWTNLRFVTASLLAMEVLAKAGPGGAARPMTSSAELALTDRVVRALLKEGELRYFGRAGAPPGLAVALHRAIRDLRLDGRTSRDIRPDHFLVAEKGRELALILARYERALVDEGELAHALAAAAPHQPRAIDLQVEFPADHEIGGVAMAAGEIQTAADAYFSAGTQNIRAADLFVAPRAARSSSQPA